MHNGRRDWLIEFIILGGSTIQIRFDLPLKQRKVHKKTGKKVRETAFWERLPHNLG
jgi:hypothetical protein